MTREKDTPSGVFIPELREVLSRLRDKEPELDEIVEEWPEPVDYEDGQLEEGEDDAEETD